LKTYQIRNAPKANGTAIFKKERIGFNSIIL
jgi:hypothetical protein